MISLNSFYGRDGAKFGKVKQKGEIIKELTQRDTEKAQRITEN
jgi:hypothetical protein